MSQLSRAERRKQKHDRVREEICEAAARAFARSGYDGATMSQIAQEAGFAAPTLYSYFDGKKEIFEALTDKVRVEFFHYFDEPVPAGITLEQHLEIVLQRQLQWTDERADELKCLSAESQDPDDRRSFVLEFQLKSQKLFERYPETDFLKGVDLERAAFLFWLVNNGYHDRRFRMGVEDVPPSAREIIAVFSGACRGVAAFDAEDA